jgi:CHAD domain-containing protein
MPSGGSWSTGGAGMVRADRNQPRDAPVGYCRFGAGVIRKQLKAFEAEIGEVESRDDIEAVHRMRVASRRLRAALPLFSTCFPEREYRRWYAGIRKITRSLGEARDLDVQLQFLDGFIRSDSPAGPGIGRLRAGMVRRRDQAQESIVAALTRFGKKGIIPEIRGCLRSCNPPSGPVEAERYSPVLFRKALDTIEKRLLSFLQFEDWVTCEDCIHEHHRQRIEAKKLRYTLETFAPLFPERLKAWISMMKEFQDLLGAMHDCDVWISLLPPYLSDDRERISGPEDPEAAIDSGNRAAFLLRDRQEERKARYIEFTRLWEDHAGHRSWSGLIRVLAVPAAVPSIDLTEDTAPPTPVAIIGDLDGDPKNLAAVLADIRERGIMQVAIVANPVGIDQDHAALIHQYRETGTAIAALSRDGEEAAGDGSPSQPKKSTPRNKKLKRGTGSGVPPDTAQDFTIRSLPPRLMLKTGAGTVWVEPGLRFPGYGGPGASVLAAALPADVIITGGLPGYRCSGGTLILSPGPMVMGGGSIASYTVVTPERRAVRWNDVHSA